MSQDWQMNTDMWEGWMRSRPFLKRMHEERIFSVGLLQNGNLGIVEGCDEWFSLELTVEDVTAWIADMETLKAEMIAARETKTDD